MEAKPLTNFLIPDYLRLERETDTRYEYHAGRLVAMAGGTLEHGLISGNIFAELKSGIRAGGLDCTAINGEVKLYIAPLNKFVYPDAMVICGSIQQPEEASNAVANPALVVEVLSQSTAHYDRGDKFYFYRQLPSLQEYILIDQYQAAVDVYARAGDLWKINRYSGLQGDVPLSTLGIKLKMEQIYEGISFTAP